MTTVAPLSEVETPGEPSVPVPRRNPGGRRGTSWLPLAPFFMYSLICLGLPTWALIYEAARRTDPVTHMTSWTTTNLTTSWHGFYLTAMWGDRKSTRLNSSHPS